MCGKNQIVGEARGKSTADANSSKSGLRAYLIAGLKALCPVAIDHTLRRIGLMAVSGSTGLTVNCAWNSEGSPG